MAKKKRKKKSAKRTKLTASGKRIGRPPKENKEINPHVTVGRHPKQEIDFVDSAYEALGFEHRSTCYWPVILAHANTAPGLKQKYCFKTNQLVAVE